VTVLHAVLTHRAPEDVVAHLAALRRALPGGAFAVCYGGTREAYERIEGERKVFLAEPTLRQRIGKQTYVSVLRDVWTALVAPDPDVAYVHLVEFDHVYAHAGYEDELLRTLDATGADWLGRHCVDRTHTNWWHAMRVLDDDELIAFLGRLAGNPEPSQVRIFGGIANAATVSRRALERFVAVEDHLHRYVELYVPTVMHHLGLRVRDAYRVSRIFDHVRNAPAYEAAEIARFSPGGAFALHPVKDYALLPAVTALIEA
jgi:hypothetical protein